MAIDCGLGGEPDLRKSTRTHGQIYSKLASTQFPNKNPLRSVTTSRSDLWPNDFWSGILFNFVPGLFLGFSVSVGLGLSPLANLAFSAFTGVGVLVSGSLVSYVVLQTISLASLAFLSRITFGFNGNLSIDSELFQTGYILLLISSPLLTLIPLVKSALNSISISKAVQFGSAVTLVTLVLFLRSRLPSDAAFGLSKMYFGEDNGGIISQLSFLLKEGYSSGISHYGEFINGIYFGAAGLIERFGDNSNPGLLTVLTHFNMTFMFMAWLPIAAMLTLALSGLRFSRSVSIVVILVMSALLAILFWPFVTAGHTGVMSSGMLGMGLLGLTFNQKLFSERPVVFATLVSALAYLVGTSWLPLMPFSAAVVAVTFAGLLWKQYQKGNQKVVLALTTFFVALAVILLPSIIGLVSISDEYLKLPGGSRSATHTLIVLWAVILVLVLWAILSNPKKDNSTSQPKFVTLLSVGSLVLSTVYLSIAGLVGNSGQLGYGATKYLLTAISFSLPVFWLVLIHTVRSIRAISAISLGIVLLSAVLMAQPDSRKIPLTIAAPSIGALEFLDANDKDYLESPNADVIAAITKAVAKAPDHIVCASDFGFPAPGGELNYESYACNRWSRSLLGDESPAEWAVIPLDMSTKSALKKARERYEGKKIVLIRIANPVGATNVPLEKSETWWIDYTDKSWEIITVR